MPHAPHSRNNFEIQRVLILKTNFSLSAPEWLLCVFIYSYIAHQHRAFFINPPVQYRRDVISSLDGRYGIAASSVLDFR
jgi:hypothetical protein